MVAAGVHFVEKRVFHHLDAYLKGIIALDPKYIDVYRYADTLLNLSTVEMPKENLTIARRIQERGLKEFPHDPELWLSTGQFMAYLAPNRFTDEATKREWRMAAIPILQHACDIWPTQEALPDTCLNSATLYNQAGEIGAAIDSLERLIAVTDDEGLRARAAEKLRRLAGERAARKVQESLQYLQPLREQDLPAVSQLRYQLLSPPFDESRCVGEGLTLSKIECATSFLDRSEIIEKAQKR
jgi:tetratricopeptide (TPR) repeat protein